MSGHDAALEALLVDYGRYGREPAQALLDRLHNELVALDVGGDNLDSSGSGRWPTVLAILLVALGGLLAWLLLRPAAPPPPTAATGLPAARAPLRRVVPRAASGTAHGYIAYLPADHAHRRLPLLLVLHGVGEKGDGEADLTRVEARGPGRLLATADPAFPAKELITVLPQSSSGWWHPDGVAGLIDHLCARYPIDPQRIVLCGYSSGASACWDLARQAPERVRALLVAGTATDAPAQDPALPGVAIWAIHALEDEQVNWRNSRRWCEAVVRARHGAPQRDLYASMPRPFVRDHRADHIPGLGWRWTPSPAPPVGRIGFTLVAGEDHASGAAWFARATTWQWLLAQTRSPPPPAPPSPPVPPPAAPPPVEPSLPPGF